MKIFFAAAATIAVCVAQPAIAKQAHSFTHEGTTYRYTVKDIGGDKSVVSGTTSDGAAFRLYVSKTKVEGQFGASQVAFSRDAVTQLSLNADAEKRIAAK